MRVFSGKGGVGGGGGTKKIRTKKTKCSGSANHTGSECDTASVKQAGRPTGLREEAGRKKDKRVGAVQ